MNRKLLEPKVGRSKTYIKNMKSLSKLILSASIATLLFACNKENPSEVSDDQLESSRINESAIIDQYRYPELSVQNGVLCFNSIEYYESIVSDESENYAVDELTDYLNTTSFISYGKTYGENSEYCEPFMDAIMNEDKVVKIGEWFIYIDIPTEKVLAISEKEENAYSSLLEFSNRNIKEFNIGDDVLDHLTNGTNPEERSCGGIGGGTYPAYSNINNAQIIGAVGGTDIRLNCGVKMFRAGIYFRLSSLYELWPNVSGINGVFNINVEVGGPEGWRQKRPCNSGSIGTIGQNTITLNSWSRTGQATFYSGTRNLNGFYFFVRSRCTNCGTGWTPFGGRNINSPY